MKIVFRYKCKIGWVLHGTASWTGREQHPHGTTVDERKLPIMLVFRPCKVASSIGMGDREKEMQEKPVNALLSMTTTRDELRAEENVRFVDRAQYCQLLTCEKTLTRCDIPFARIRGIFDPAKRLRYLIEEERLFPKLSLKESV